MAIWYIIDASMTPSAHTGKIIPNGVSLEKHENDTVVFFTELGKAIELIRPSNMPHLRHADLIMDGIEWEMKSPETASKIVVERSMHKALKQSCNVIIDLRRAKGKEKVAIEHLLKCFASSKRIRRLYIITKKQELLDYRK